VADVRGLLLVGLAALALAGCSSRSDANPAAEQHTEVYCTVRVVVAPSRQIMADARGENDCHLAEAVATTAIASIKRLSP